MFALVDANSFYCSAEQVFRPEWRGKPVIVLSNNDGCIVAANREAKEAGIEKFKPYFEVKNLCDNKGVIALSSNYELYSDLSGKMMNVIGRYAPEQYIYSIDESFLRFENTEQIINLLEQGHLIRRAVWTECRLAVCVGMGPTLTLAKAANHAAKKINSYQGVCIIDTDEHRLGVLSKMSVSDVWGVGRKSTKHLSYMGITTALQLAQMPPKKARTYFSVEMERVVLELNGVISKSWDQGPIDKKQIFSTRSVGNRITDIEELSQALCKHAGIAAAKARKSNLLSAHLMAFAGNSPFDDRPQNFKFTQRFEVPTNDSIIISELVSKAAKVLFKPGMRYYKIGVGLLDLSSAKHYQQDLFSEDKSNPKLMDTIDNLNHRYGSGTMVLAGQGVEQKWAMRRDKLTPQYTTKWSDIPSIVC
jgi:DNA polymerase V